MLASAIKVLSFDMDCDVVVINVIVVTVVVYTLSTVNY